MHEERKLLGIMKHSHMCPLVCSLKFGVFHFLISSTLRLPGNDDLALLISKSLQSCDHLETIQEDAHE